MADFKYEAAKISGWLKTSLSEPTYKYHLYAQREIANCAEMLFNRLGSVRMGSSFKSSASLLGTNAAAAGTELSTSAGLSCKEGPQ